MSLQQLAIEGGTPARSHPDKDRVMRIGALQIGGSERAAVNSVLKQQILYRYHGGTVASFEEGFASWLGDRAVRCLAVNSGSSALLLAFAALNLQPGDEVLVPTIGFISAVTAVMAARGVPRFVPVDESLCMNLEAAAALVTDRTRALLAVHPYGSACNLAELQVIADRAGIVVIEDAAQACGATFRGRRVGTFGSVSCFSFQHFKLLTTGEGGMVATSNGDLLDRISFMHDAAALWTMPERSKNVTAVSFPPLNLRMSELEGALGLSQLEKCDATVACLRQTNALLRGSLQDKDGIVLRPHVDAEGEIGSSLIFYLRDPSRVRWVVEALQAEGVKASSLRGEPGMNRHWVEDWVPILNISGYSENIEPPFMVGPCDLDAGVIFPIDIRYSKRDIEETTLALDKVISRL